MEQLLAAQQQRVKEKEERVDACIVREDSFPIFSYAYSHIIIIPKNRWNICLKRF